MFRRYAALILLVSSLFGLSGCATVVEGLRGLAGNSTKILEESRKNAIGKVFGYDYDTAQTKTEEALKTMKHAVVYARDPQKKMIAIYYAEVNTTPVGIFFTATDPTHTQIEIASPSTTVKEYFAKKLFMLLEVK